MTNEVLQKTASDEQNVSSSNGLEPSLRFTGFYENWHEKYIKDVLAHEILHTCFLCKTHDYPWNHYAKIMNDKYGYNIKKLYHSWKEIGVEV